MYRLRFNSVAFQALDANGELPENGRFPTGSILVKESYINSSPNILTVIKKAPTDPNAGDGWLWAEFRLDGTPTISITDKGNHAQVVIMIHRIVIWYGRSIYIETRLFFSNILFKERSNKSDRR